MQSRLVELLVPISKEHLMITELLSAMIIGIVQSHSMIISTGADITDIGLALTPMLHFAVVKHQYTGGCMITASHNPKEHNGFKFDGPNFDPIYNDHLQEIL